MIFVLVFNTIDMFFIHFHDVYVTFYNCRIYTLQANHKSFATVLELLTAMNPQFVNAMNTSAYSGFQEKGFSQRIIDELITATLTANYGQSTTVHEFVGK